MIILHVILENILEQLTTTTERCYSRPKKFSGRSTFKLNLQKREIV